ncbi:GNAT family N-acetyltransferase [uncultured Draconibacterium sp.]|uniref:GNAT family N-acetyltransferase n=1 Tax=uncultured Draconibacterium sp. TaxID=1573823 RepID=UPI003260ADBB
MEFREINSNDIPAIFSVRLSTDENHFSYKQLVEHGISYESVKEKIEKKGKGWVCEINKTVAGFVIADGASGEIWMIAVVPSYINKKIGSQLLTIAENWLKEKGHKRFWLITDPDKTLRAYSFYLKHGWAKWKEENGILFMHKEVL